MGDPLFSFSIALMALDAGGGPSEVGLVFGARSLAGLSVTLAGGVLADRLSRRAVMIAADLCRAGLVAVIALLPARAPAAALAALVFLVGSGETVFRPAYRALLPSLVDARQLQAANALTSITLRTSALAGPALAGLLVATTGTRGALLTDAATFLASISTLALLRERDGGGAPARSQPLRAAVAAGAGVLVTQRWIGIMVAASLLQASLSVAPWAVLVPVVARSRLHGGPAYATILVAFAAGSLVGGLLASRVRARRPGVVGCLCVSPFAAAMASLAAPVPLPAIAACHLLAGAGLEVYTVLWVTALQSEVPRDLLGRVFAADQMGTLALAPIAYALTGPAAQVVGPAPVLLAGAGATLATTILPLLDAEVRRFSSRRPAGGRAGRR